MRKFLTIAVLIFVWSLLVTGSFVVAALLKTPPIAVGDIVSLEKHLNNAFANAENDERFGAAGFVLVQEGKVYATRAFGVSDPQLKNPTNNKSLFFMASVSKAVTTWGILKLVQQGKIGIDEPVLPHLKRWRFPGSESFRDRVTVRHLLTHTSGIVDGFGFSGFPEKDSVQTLEDALDFPKDSNSGEAHPTTITSEPGTRMSYSSAGYMVVQLLIEEISGKAFETFMREEVFHPLKMNSASYSLDTILASGNANNIVANYDKDLAAFSHRRFANMAGVSLRMSLEDAGKFLSAYRDNPIVDKKILHEIYQPQAGTGSSWGIGHEIKLRDSLRTIAGHGGGAFPRSGASFWVNSKTGNGICIMMSGGKEMIDPYINDWIYFETGEKIFDIRNVIHEHGLSIGIMIFLGTIAIFARKKIFFGTLT